MQDPLIPSQLLNQRYQLFSRVGTGGFGAVYKAADTRFGDRLVAIKEISLHGLTPQEAIEATDTFNREVALLSGLDHPNLPHIYDHFTDSEHWYLVMDFIEGETLEEVLQKTTSLLLPHHSPLKKSWTWVSNCALCLTICTHASPRLSSVTSSLPISCVPPQDSFT